MFHAEFHDAGAGVDIDAQDFAEQGGGILAAVIRVVAIAPSPKPT